MKMKCLLLRMKPSLLRIKFELNLEYKKESCLQDSPPAAGRFSDKFPFRRSAILPGGLYYFIGDFIEISYEIIKGSANPFDTLCIFDLQILFLFFYIFFTYFNHHNLPNKQDSHPSLFLFQILSSCYIMLK